MALFPEGWAYYNPFDQKWHYFDGSIATMEEGDLGTESNPRELVPDPLKKTIKTVVGWGIVILLLWLTFQALSLYARLKGR